MWYLVCNDPAFDGVGTCTNQSWVLVQGLLPSLTITQGLQIGGAIGAVWGLAFCVRMLRKFLWR